MNTSCEWVPFEPNCGNGKWSGSCLISEACTCDKNYTNDIIEGHDVLHAYLNQCTILISDFELELEIDYNRTELLRKYDDLEELDENDEIEPRNMTPWLILLGIVFIIALIGIVIIPIRLYCKMRLNKIKKEKIKKYDLKELPTFYTYDGEQLKMPDKKISSSKFKKIKSAKYLHHLHHHLHQKKDDMNNDEILESSLQMSRTSSKNVNSILTNELFLNKYKVEDEEIKYQNVISEDENNDLFHESDNKFFPKYNMTSVVINKYNLNDNNSKETND